MRRSVSQAKRDKRCEMAEEGKMWVARQDSPCEQRQKGVHTRAIRRVIHSHWRRPRNLVPGCVKWKETSEHCGLVSVRSSQYQKRELSDTWNHFWSRPSRKMSFLTFTLSKFISPLVERRGSQQDPVSLHDSGARSSTGLTVAVFSDCCLVFGLQI